MEEPRVVGVITLKSDRAVHTRYVGNVRVGDAPRRQLITLYGYGAKRIRKSNCGRFSMARTTRLTDVAFESQRVISPRKRERENMNTTNAPIRAAQYERNAPAQDTNVYPDKTMRVE